MLILKLCICAAILLNYCDCLMHYLNPTHPLVKKASDADNDFDVFVLIFTWKKRGNIAMLATGLLLDNYRVLTTFNPFRKISRSRSEKRFELMVKRSIVRKKQGWSWTNYNVLNVTCGRQVAYMTEADIARINHTRLSPNYPLHDLMVLRMHNYVPNIPVTEHKIHYGPLWFAPPPLPYDVVASHLPVIIDIADPTDILEGPMKIGYMNTRAYEFADSTLYKRYGVEPYSYYLYAIYIGPDALTDCRFWFPVEWGYFICVKKPRSHFGIASGGILIADNKVFGLACFALDKGAEGIYAFTDVRVYKENIDNTCTKDDK